jgi:hypothetical protein
MNQPRPSTREGVARGRGLSLVELLLGLVVTALVGGAIAMTLQAVAYGTQDGKNMRRVVVTEKALSNRLNAALRNAKMVLAAPASGAAQRDWIVLWIPGPTVGEEPRLSELQRIVLDRNAQTIISYRNADDVSEATYPLDTNFNTLTQNLVTGGQLDAETWARGVSDWSIVLDQVSVQEAALVSYRMTLTAGTLSDVGVSAVAIRNVSASE